MDRLAQPLHLRVATGAGPDDAEVAGGVLDEHQGGVDAERELEPCLVHRHRAHEAAHRRVVAVLRHPVELLDRLELGSAAQRAGVALDLGAERPIIAPRINLFVFDESILVDELAESVLADDIIMHAVLLAVAPGPGGGRDRERHRRKRR